MRPSVGVVVAALLICGAVRADEPVVPARSEVVRVEVVVTDATGAPVRELAREDFQVLEDGKPQAIANFVPLASKEAKTAQDPAAGRKLVIVVDDFHLSRASLEPAKEAVARLVAEWAAPQDEIGLVTTAAAPGPIELSVDRSGLRQMINGISSHLDVAQARGSQLDAAQAELILRGDTTALKLAARLEMEQPGPGASGGTPRGALGANQPLQAGIDPEERDAAAEVQRQARVALLSALRYSEATLSTLEQVLRGMEPLPGPKLCLLVSDGFLIGRGTSDELTRPLRQVTDAATRSGVSLYALQARSLAASASSDASVEGPAGPPGMRERVARMAEEAYRDTLDRVSGDTGGFPVRGSELAPGLRRMLEDSTASYLLSYEPPAAKRDGRFHTIAVRLPRHADYVVRSRKGYLAADDKSKAAVRPAARPVVAAARLDEAEARAALQSPAPPGAISVRLVADYVDLPPQGSQAIVQARVDSAGLPWQVVEGRHRTQLELLGGAYDDTGKPAGPIFARRFALDLAPSEFERASADGIRYRQRVALPPGRYEVRLLVRDTKRAPLGGAVQRLEIPDLADKKLALSSLFLSSSSPGDAAQADMHEAQLASRFKSGEALTFQLYVYNAPADEATRDIVLQAQIRSGSKVIAASRPQPVAARQKDGVLLPETNSLPLEGLTPGAYELRVVVVDRKANVTLFRETAFAVD